MSDLLKPCADCGEVSDQARCPDHRPTTTELRGSTPAERGYDAAWRRLSAKARRMQPWCSDAALGRCAGPLTCDHLPSAWERKALGLPLRLCDVDVVCRDHNTERGTSRPGSRRASVLENLERTRGVVPPAAPSSPDPKAGSATHTPGGTA